MGACQWPAQGPFLLQMGWRSCYLRKGRASRVSHRAVQGCGGDEGTMHMEGELLKMGLEWGKEERQRDSKRTKERLQCGGT